jgi:hypothetical protein
VKAVDSLLAAGFVEKIREHWAESMTNACRKKDVYKNAWRNLTERCERRDLSKINVRRD